MRKFLLILPLVGALAACENMTDQQMVGTAGGAAVGAVLSPGNPIAGAAVGGALGLAAGTYLGKDHSGRCVYRGQDGRRHTGPCA